MLKLDGKTLSYDRAFTHDNINYPANWLRLSTLAEKNAIGITEVDGPAWYDQRFYWGVDNPKDIDGLKANWISKQKDTAGKLLAATDWMVTRKAETDTAIPADTTTYRASVRTVCGEREAQITACADTDALYALMTASPNIAGTADNGATEKKDAEDKSYDPKRYEAVVNPAAIKAWPS